jgi:hypothetical protein
MAKKPVAIRTYRGQRRNLIFGRKAVGNTKPEERRFIWALAKGITKETAKCTTATAARPRTATRS